MNEDDFYRDLDARITANVIGNDLESSLLAIEHYIPEHMWGYAEEYVREYFCVA